MLRNVVSRSLQRAISAGRLIFFGRQQRLAALYDRYAAQATVMTALAAECSLTCPCAHQFIGTGSKHSPHAATSPADLQSDLVNRLRSHGIQVEDNEPVFLHVGFGHAGTTSLQRNFLSRRSDLFYVGTPFPDANELFAKLKFIDSFQLSEMQMLEWCRDLVYHHPQRRGRPIVVSDESLCDTTEVYYCPRHLPADTVAMRLKRYFPTAKIVFTIRSQLDYISSMYFNLKRNFAFLAGCAMPSFKQWWEGMHSQIRCLYLQNLDYSVLVELYARLFGRENVLVLPLELLKQQGARTYLERLCGFMGLEVTDTDLDNLRVPQNERMTVVENRLAKIAASGSGELPVVQALLEKENLAFLVEHSPKLTVDFSDEQVDEVKRLVAAGNRRLMRDFDLPLGELGYFV